MSKTVFGAILSFVILIGLCIGWFLGAPKPPVLSARFHQVATEAVSEAPPGSDSAPGWKERNTLRDHLTTAIAQLKADPCDEAKRTAFLGAFVDRSLALVDDDHRIGGEDGAPFWRTSNDAAIQRKLDELVKLGDTTQDEYGLAVVKARLGSLPAGADLTQARIPTALTSRRCKSSVGPTAGLRAARLDGYESRRYPR